MKLISYQFLIPKLPWKYIAIGTIVNLGIVAVLSQIPHLLAAVQPSTASAQDTTSTQTSKDEVIRWNALTLDTIRTEKTSAAMAARNLAMVHAAVYDAVNAISKTHKVYRVNIQAPKGASAEAAAITAAHRVLVNLYPKQVTNIDEVFNMSLAELANDQSKTMGVELGHAVADQILAWRDQDGADSKVTYTPINKPGMWQPVPPDFKPAAMPYWKNVKPFAMTQGSQFRIVNLPSLTSADYGKEFNYTKELGAKDSKTRTPDQTAIAQFWLNGSGTVTLPGHWNQIAADVAVRRGNTLQQNARLFALLNIALADASITESDQKYTFNRWRPITGIRQAEKDGNPQTISDLNWAPLLTTPNSPSYVSGHSTFSGAADVVLTALFGRNGNFTTSADPSLNIASRSFKSFSQAAEEVGMSRIYSGAHWLSDNRDGLTAGRNLGKYVVQDFLTPR